MASYPYTVGPETVLGANGNFGNSGVAAVGNNEIVSLSVTNVEFSLFPPENYENIYFRLVDALNGEPLDSQTEVGTGFLPEIATASSGFLVTYSTLNDAPVPGENNATGGNLVGQLYASSGSPLGSPFVIVAGSTSPGPEPAQIVTGFGFALTGLADGNFAASYQLETLNLLSYGHYSAEITNYTSVISHTGSLITAFVIGNSVLPPVQLADGNLITANTDGVEEFTESGSLVASVTTSGNPVAMAALADGDFVIAEGSASLSPVSIDLFSPNGDLIASNPEPANAGESMNTYSLTPLTNGQFVATWSSSSSDSAANIHAIIFNQDDSTASGEFLVNTITSGVDGRPDSVGLPNDGLYVTWEDNSGLAVGDQIPDTSGSAIKGQLLQLDNTPNFINATQIFLNNSSGNVAVSSVEGISSVAGTLSLAQPTESLPNTTTDWSVAGVGDFGGNGQQDILWRSTSGQDAISFMNGDQVVSTQYTGSATSDWTVAGTGDFKGDGNSDILWHDPATNQYAIWLMNGPTVSSAQLLNAPSPDWSVAGVGDFNGDGKADILWRNTSGQDAIWFMNGTTPTSEEYAAPATTDWSVAGVGDFNGDGKADILWRNTSGQDAIWDMSGATVLSSQYTDSASPDWHVAGITDFNHDGLSDILWQNTSGTIAAWEMNNASVLNSSILASPTNDWTAHVG